MLNSKAKYLYKELQRSLKSKSKRFTKVSQGIESKRNNIISRFNGMIRTMEYKLIIIW